VTIDRTAPAIICSASSQTGTNFGLELESTGIVLGGDVDGQRPSDLGLCGLALPKWTQRIDLPLLRHLASELRFSTAEGEMV
jgi:hypothetical protein